MKIEITISNSTERFAVATELQSLGVEYSHPSYSRNVFILESSKYIAEGIVSFLDEKDITYSII